jgi:hypothetical protein
MCHARPESHRVNIMSFQFQSVIQECHSFPAVNCVVLMFRGQLDEGQMALSNRQ